MRQEVALEPDGTPCVRPFRTDEGQLVFRYLTVRPGGMSVWVEVPPDALAGVPKTPGAVDRQLRAAALGLARSIAAGDAARQEANDALIEQVEALGEELEAARRRIAELEDRLSRVPPDREERKPRTRAAA